MKKAGEAGVQSVYIKENETHHLEMNATLIRRILHAPNTSLFERFSFYRSLTIVYFSSKLTR